MKLLRIPLARLSPAGPRAPLTVLIFHRIFAEPDPLFPGEPGARWFDSMLEQFKVWFNVLPLDEAIDMRAAYRLPERAAAITFDDGYADNYTVARPILERHGLSATFFVATGFLDGGRMWNDTVIEVVRRTARGSLALDLLGLGVHPVASLEEKRRAIEALLSKLKYRLHDDRASAIEAIRDMAGVPLPDDLMMTSDQVLGMRRSGMGVGAHTVTHPILAALDDATARREIVESKRALESILGQPVPLFAYPNGKLGSDYSIESVAIVRECGFKAAVSTRAEVCRPDEDMFQISRHTPWERQLWRFGARLAEGLFKR